MRTIGTVLKPLTALLIAGAVHVANGQGVESWLPAPEMPAPRSGVVAASIDGSIYVAGGRDDRNRALDVLERFDPVAGVWTQLAPMPTPRYGAAAVALDGLLYVMGGRGPRPGTGSERHVLDVVEVYDPSRDIWESSLPLHTAREGHVAFVLGDTVFVVGGSDRTQTILSSIEYLAPGSDAGWQVDANLQMEVPRAAHAVAVVKGRALLFGGFTPVPVNLVEEFQNSRRPFLLPPGLFRARGALAAVGFGDTVFVAGGRGPGGGPGRAQEPVLNDVDAYVVSTGEWHASASLSTARESFGAVVVGRRIYVFGGRDEDGDALASAEVMELASATSAETPEIAEVALLLDSAPNPFSGRTTIRFDVGRASSGAVSLRVYDTTGRLVRILVDGFVANGRHEVEWDGRSDSGAPVASGIYLCRLTQGSNLATGKLVLVR